MKRDQLKKLLPVAKLSKEPQVWLTQADALAFGERVAKEARRQMAKRIRRTIDSRNGVL
jgi:hypothetical protein